MTTSRSINFPARCGTPGQSYRVCGPGTAKHMRQTRQDSTRRVLAAETSKDTAL